MKSMTSYGYAQFTDTEYVMTFEIKSYNNRYLDIVYNAPSYLSMYEIPISDTIKKFASRGHVEVNIRIRNIYTSQSMAFDEYATASYSEMIKKIVDVSNSKGLDISVNLSDILSAPGILSDISSEQPEKYREGVETCMKIAMAQFEDGKVREGNATRDDIASMLDRIDKSLSVVKDHASELEFMIKENLTARINEMLGDMEYDSSRILTEVAVMLMRYTINEETVRLGTHIAEFRKLLDSLEPSGKRIDFLCQEMNREINTIGSKSQMVEVNLEVVNMKDCLENIREQIRNVE